jgi:glycerol-3-phosphate acyltransferase PlsX
MPDISIAVDVMGGDNAPASVVEGARLALDEFDLELILAGPEDLLHDEFDDFSPDRGQYEIRHADETIEMDDDPIQAVRQKKNSSLHVAADAVSEGDAQALVSAGNTGAVMAGTKLKLGVQEHVDRPAIATQLPTEQGDHSILIDSGANVDCTPQQLLQFAVMGSVFAERVLGKDDPSIGLLNLGTEVMKGNEQVKKAFELFQDQPIRFTGNVEGQDVLSGNTDVIVCDGFVGNIALKLSEGVASTIFNFLKDKIDGSLRGWLGGALLKPMFKELLETIDPAEYGGAPLLGLNGGCIISHGSSSPKAIKNAIHAAQLFVLNDCNEEIGERMTTLRGMGNDSE